MEPGQPVQDVTRILEAIRGGDMKAADELLPVVYDELRRLAARKLSYERPGQTLQATALVHEAYLRLVGSRDRGWENRQHFFCTAAEAMRVILVDRARRRQALRHGGGRERRELDEVEAAVEPPCDDLLALNEALERLARMDGRKAELVKLRYFAGLTNEEAASALGISPSTAKRWWRYARVWLLQEISAERGQGGPCAEGGGQM
jgi:RNA polymerase sigma factor (TIGR02999 family)